MYRILGIAFKTLLVSGFVSLTAIEYFKTFFEKKDIKKSCYFIWVIYYVWQLISGYLIEGYPIWCRMVLGILFCLVTSYYFDGYWLAKVIFSVLLVVLWVLNELLIGSLFLILKIPIETNILAGSIFSKLLLLLFVKALQLFFYDSTIYGLSWKNSLMFMFLPVGSLVIVYYIFTTGYIIDQPGVVLVAIICILIIIVINIIIFTLYVNLSKNMELENKNMIYEKEFELLDIYIKEKEDAAAEFRKKRHDLKYQMLKLLDLLNYKQYEQLEKDIVQLAEIEPIKDIKISVTGNSVIDAFVNYKYGIARKNKINFNLNIDIPSSLPFADGDLCVILGNLLDNALEANFRSKVDNPYINLNIKYDRNNIIIIVENSFDGKLKRNNRGEKITLKEDKKNHGIGIKSIKNIVKKYNGYYNVTLDSKVYCVSILLYSRFDI